MAETSQGQPDDAVIDLLVKQVTEGLSAAEQRELDVLDSETASAYLRDLERAAAAVSVAASAGVELPAQFVQRIAQQAEQHFGSRPSAASGVTRLSAAREARRAPGWAAGWWAAAACLVLAVFGWLRSPTLQTPVVALTPPVFVAPPALPPPPAPVPLTPAEERTAMLANPLAVKGALAATKDPAAKGVSGDFVWDQVAQKGFLHFAGLASNDPRVSQYQIWIFDAARDQKYPIDAGVFDVPAGNDEVVIPINAVLNVSKAAAFAVTVEKPGGVVVSLRQHVVVLGATS